ncbi:PfaD family polyunsaturated fatty acid/polyketide biosynthesis protein [Marininema halotolerans]|uniref:PfaD family protein n=1 Tax=Marininema halotolerans TaxID=1155944 RepID=A0A1I6PQZ7_9BACL|nr:PfaD family polyunsaturated fatty acid/polyketide biosynthesis protein [Marininema halotolerans]SFS42465.1 PfaD family protein [Marininema halotolerans]
MNKVEWHDFLQGTISRLKLIVANLLKVQRDSLNTDHSFLDMGINSILSVELIEEINDEFGLNIGVDAVFDYPDPTRLAIYIAELLQVEKGADKYKNEGLNSRRKNIEYSVIRVTADILQVESDRLDVESSFLELGINSMLAVDLVESINEKFNLDLGVEVVFDYRSIKELVTYIESINHSKINDERMNQEQTPSLMTDIKDKNKDIAIIGVSGKLAESKTIEEFWHTLQSGTCSIKEINRTLWQNRRYDRFDSGEKNQSMSRGGALKEIDRFDASFFHIPPEEAKGMDPQQRLFLEEAYKAVEDGGYAGEKLSGRKVGVFVGGRPSDYRQRGSEHEQSPHTFLGNEMSTLASRISYFFNLRGPSLAIDTACSSSLVAIHLACESIRRGESEMALAGGVFVMSSPEFLQMSSQAGLLSPDGKCHTFDESANGMVLGEAVGVVVLKSLDEALRDNDHIYGVIKGSTVNQAGKTNGFSSPSMLSQKELIAECYKNAQISPETISYIEAHGTGAKISDSMEVKALIEAFQMQTDRKQFCAIGTHKPNIGHTAMAAGIASLFKVLMAMKYREIPPTISVKNVSEMIHLENSPFYLTTKPIPWKSQDHAPLRAGISALGSNGTNCHLIVEESSVRRSSVEPLDYPAYLFPFSAKTKESLQQRISDMATWLERESAQSRVQDVSYTLLTARSHFPLRCAFVARDFEELKEQFIVYLSQGVVPVKGIHKRLHGERSLQQYGDHCIDQLVTHTGSTKDFIEKLHDIRDLYHDGYQFDWGSLFSRGECSKVPLPSYPFSGDSYWLFDKPQSSKGRTLPFSVTSARGLHVKEMDELFSKLLWGQLQSVGMFTANPTPISTLINQSGVKERYFRWFKETIRFLVQYQYLSLDGEWCAIKNDEHIEPEELWAEWDRSKVRWLNDQDTRAQAILAETMLRELPEIITGKKLATDMMFPNSSMELVEGIYNGNPVADYFNEVLADQLVADVEKRLQQDPFAKIRCIEIGAGTGGTSAVILKRLQPYQEQIQEYCYTDLSKSFLMHAEEKFGNQYPYVTYRLLDIEKPMIEQGMDIGKFDFVIATNVLHATQSMRTTLEHAKSLLKNQGLLLLNEISGNSLFLHLTFGLLEGWWLYEDPELRREGCPALSPHSWKSVLYEKGFSTVGFPVEETHSWGQQIIVAESDGVIQHILQPTKGTLDKEVDQQIVSISHHGRTAGDDRDSETLDYVKGEIVAELSKALNVAKEMVDEESSFRDFGVDSITGVRLVRSLNERFQVNMETIILFDYSSVQQLAAYILCEYPDEIAVVVGENNRLLASSRTDEHGDQKAIGQPVPVEDSKRDLQSLASEPIAIIGMSGRFAQSNNVDELWEHLENGRDLVEKVTRWDLSKYYDNNQPYCKHGSLLERIDQFDPLFFNISGTEAEYMDPQQRIFLEESWKALEDAGYATGAKGRDCGVYVGCDQGNYQQLIDDQAPPQSFWGNLVSLIPARIAYHLDLQGPAISVDSACSSSLVAVHLACQGLWMKETDMALAGGIFIQSTPDFYQGADRAGMLSPSGRCYTFDERADGMVPGEAAGVVVLKRLSDAVRDHDHIYGVIKGSGINQDGTTNGITAPSLRSQERLIRKIYEKFGIDAADIQMVEAHGTGTKLGDPIEFHALSRAFRQDTDQEGYCAIGSIKTNLGHTQIAAGITGLIKVLLSLKYRQIPPALHFESGNENIHMEGSPFYVNTRLKSWETAPGEKRLAALSAFGASGTNAHMVIEEAPTQQKKSPEKPVYFIPLSAQTSEQLRQQAKQLITFCKKNPSADLGNMSFTLMLGRKHMKERLACVTENIQSLVSQLMTWLKKGEASQVFVADSIGNPLSKRPSLKRYGNQWIDDCQTLQNAEEYREQLSAIADLYVQGVELSYGNLFADKGYSRMPLPTYPFAKERYWVEGKPIHQPDGISSVEFPQGNETVVSISPIGSIDSKPASLMENSSTRTDFTKDHSVKKMVFAEKWKEQLTDIVGESAYPQKLVCFLSNAEQQEALRQGIQALSPETSVVFIAKGGHSENRALDSSVYDVDGGEAPSYQAVFERIQEANGEIDAIAYLWPLEEKKRVKDYDTLLAWFQGMIAAGVRPKRLLLAGAFTQRSEQTYLESWIGLERSLQMVLPKTHMSLLIGESTTSPLSHVDMNEWVPRVWQELINPSGKSVLYSRGTRYVRRISQLEVPVQKSLLKKRGTYLITGGGGGLGWLFAHYLAKNYKANLILTGRTALTKEMQERLGSLEALGSHVHYFQADVCDIEGMRTGLVKARQELGSIHGVIHAAGVLGKQVLSEKTKAEYHQVLDPKIQGTQIVDALLAEEALDFFCLFSSSSAILGDFGSGDYAMGNCFLTAFANERNEKCASGERRGKTVAVQWPLWREGRMGHDNDSMYLQASGQRFLEAEDGLAFFEQFIAASEEAPLVLVGQPHRVYRFLGLDQEESLLPEEAPAITEEHCKRLPGAGRTPEMKGWSTEQCVEWVITDQVSRLLKVGRERLDRRVNLTEFGFDSLSLMAFAEQLADHFAIEITPAVFYEHTSLAQVTSYLLTAHADAVAMLYGEAIEPHVSSKVEQDSLASSRGPLVQQSIEEKAPYEAHHSAWSTQSSEDKYEDRVRVPEPIAIIGMSGRFPGARNIDELWTHLAEGRNLVTDHPTTRFPEEKQRRWKGGWIPEVAEFDPMFFGISPKEAITMDPRQRLLLQESWNALEDAGIGSTQIEKGRIGMFVGVEQGDYQKLVKDEGSITANNDAILAARLAYFLNLSGPVLSIDTACSSGLVAAHQACQSLRNGECETAIAAGVNLILSTETLEGIDQAGMFSEDGFCYAFDKRANGMVPGEAVTAVVLKPLSKAMMDKDPIHAVIRGSGINYDGKTNGITAPNGAAQTELIKHVYDQFQVNPESIHYVVAHGTGTKLGDPVEVNALTQAFKSRTDETEFCALTSVKSNVGHTFAASGLVSLISLVQAMRHGTIPASLHCEEENPFIQWKDSPFYVNKTAKAWPDTTGQKRCGAVSSFGMSGTNAHMVVESYPSTNLQHNPSPPCHMLALSAQTEEALQAKIHDLLAFLQQTRDLPLTDLSYTLLQGRHHFRYRCAVVVHNWEEAVLALQQVVNNEKWPHLFKGIVDRDFAGSKVMELFAEELVGKTLLLQTDSSTYRETMAALADLYCQGYVIDGDRLFTGMASVRVHLPTYPFAGDHYWVQKKENPTLDHRVSESTIAIRAQVVPPNVELTPEAPSKQANKIVLPVLTDANAPLVKSTPPQTIRLQGNSNEQVLEEQAPTTGEMDVHSKQLTDGLRKNLADALYVEESEIDLDTNFVDMGLDSIIGVEWIKTINKEHGTSIPATKIYDYPTLREFVHYIRQQIKGENQSETPAIPLKPVMAKGSSAPVAPEGVLLTSHPEEPAKMDVKTLEKELAISLADALYMKQSDMDLDTHFVELGLDSIIGVEWIKSINQQYGTSITATKIYDYPTLRQFVLYVSEEMNQSEQRQPITVTPLELMPDRDEDLLETQSKGAIVKEKPVCFSQPEDLGNALFRERYRCKWNYYAGSMGQGVASEQLVVTMGQAKLLSVFGSAGFRTEQIEASIQRIQSQLLPGQPYGVCLIANVHNPAEEMRQAKLFVKYDVPVIEVAAFASITEALVYSRIKGITQQNGRIIVPRRLIAKCSRIEVAQRFFSPPPVDLVQSLLESGWITEEEAKLSQRIPIVDDLAVEANSGGHTDQGVNVTLLPAMNALRDEMMSQYGYEEEIMIGCGGGIGTPEAVVSVFTLGADFIFTGSINQCTVESGAHDVVKDILSDVKIHDTALTIAGDMFEIGAKVQVVKKNSRHEIRAKTLYQLYKQYHSIEDIPQSVTVDLEKNYFKRRMNEVWDLVCRYKNQHNPEQIIEAKRNPRVKMALIFKWYFAHCGHVTQEGDLSEIDNFRIFCGPAMGAFNQWVKGTPYENWRNRHVHEIAEFLMVNACQYAQTRLVSSADLITQKQVCATKEHPWKREDDSAIAIIGISGQFPHAKNLEEFWRNLEEGRDCISEVPASRWSVDQYYDPDPETLAKSHCKWMGVLEDVDQFDPMFFKITPAEAEVMDPQQRLFLESCWTAIEDAGMDPTSLSGERVGVFAGCSTGDYGKRVSKQKLNTLGLMGETTSVLAARISYWLNLKGPSMAIETACSSSLVAIAQACNSLLLHNCDQALAGGVHVLEGPSLHIMTSKGGMLSEDGRCYTFDDRANGFVPGEGVGVLLLKRLSDAVKDEDPIYGVIRGWGVNQDGKTNGMMAPSANSQRDLLQHEVYDRFGIDPEKITMIEAHGTGTKLGDPIEVEALTEAFKHYTDKTNYCALGSVKSNIGHLLTAAGIAGVLKSVLALKHRMLPPTINFSKLNEHISLTDSPFYINTELRPWNIHPGVPRCAGVSSFGFSGTNAHLVIEEYVPKAPPEKRIQESVLFVLSAKSKEQLKMYADSMRNWLAENPTLELEDVAYTLQLGRTAMSERLAIVVESKEDLLQELDAFINNQATSQALIPEANKNNDLRALFETDGEAKQLLEVWMKQRKFVKVAQLWVNGLDVNWNGMYSEFRPRKIHLPTYPFAKRRCWVEESTEEIGNAGMDRTKMKVEGDLSLSFKGGSQEPVPVTTLPVTSSPVVIEKPRGISLSTLSNKSDAPQHGKEENPTDRNVTVTLNPIEGPIKSVSSKVDSEATRVSLMESLGASLAEALFTEVDDIDVDTKFVDMGMDSIVGVEWIRSINKIFGVSLMATAIYDYSTLRQLAEYIANELNQGEKRATSSEPSPHSVPDGEVPPISIATEELLEELFQSLSEALFTEVDDIDVDSKFVDMGMDSIVGVEWIRSINKRYGISLAATTIYDFSTLRELVDDLRQRFEERGFVHPGKTNQRVRSSMSTGSDRNGLNQVPVIDRKDHPTSVEPSTRSTERQGAIAIVGMSGRYPGASHLDQYWRNLARGKNSVREIPKERWDVDTYYDERPFQQGKINCKWMGMLDDIDCFDPLFFNISPSEAEVMDPQHRIFLEEAYKTFEDAGYRPQSLDNEKCGVYLGMMNHEYGKMVTQSEAGIANTTGNSYAIASARIPYFLNLKGPAISIDTACSSSLVATHLASQALRNHEIDMALVGGVTLYLSPEGYVDMCAAGMLSPDGQCKAFDNHANGFVPGEGVGTLLLKRLEDAEADQDHIYGVIIGSGINQDGKTNGITAPSMNSQMELIQEVYERYQIDPERISYAELHGTGTKLGDPIELEALSRSFQKGTSKKNFCAIGSVKSNIGHTSAAAGVASVQKVLLSLKHQHLVPTLHVNRANEHFDFEHSPFYINDQLKPWETHHDEPRRTCISSFGYSGTNAHLVIEEYQPTLKEEKERLASQKGEPFLFTLSAQSHDQLRIYAIQLKDWISNQANVNRMDLAYTLQIGRDEMDCRLAWVATSREEMYQALSDFIDNGSIKAGFVGQVNRNRNGMAIVADQVEKESQLTHWLREKKLTLIAQAWTEGLGIDWEMLYSDKNPRRISLPTYPFARERFWLAQVPRVPASGGDGVHVLHPLLHQNISTLKEQRYRTTMTGEEFFLTDHVVKGKKTLSGSVYLEMIREAVLQAVSPLDTDANGIQLKNMVWIQPLAFESEEAIEVMVRLLPRDHDGLAFQIDSRPIGGQRDAVVHCQGIAVVQAKPQPQEINLDTLRKQCDQKRLSGVECYESFRDIGMEYGVGYQGIQELYTGENQVLAKLQLDGASMDKDDGGRYVLHPGLIDSALQASIGLHLGKEKGETFLPFSLDELNVIEACPIGSPVWAWMRICDAAEGPMKLDMDVCDSRGKVCVRMKGFSLREVGNGKEQTKRSPSGTLMLKPSWQERPLTPPTKAHHFVERRVIVCGSDIKLQTTKDGLKEVHNLAFRNE